MERTVDFSIDLNPKQKKVFQEAYSNEKIKNILLYGAARSGKTFFSFSHKFNLCLSCPGLSVVFVRKTLADIRNSMINQTFPTYLDVIYNKYKDKYGSNARLDFKHFFEFNKSEHLIRFKGPDGKFNGSTILFYGAPPNSSGGTAESKMRGAEFQIVCFDEGSDLDYGFVDFFRSRLVINKKKAVRNNVNGKLFDRKIFECLENPGSPTSWTYRFFHENKHPVSGITLPDSVKEESYIVHFSRYDNIENIDESTYSDMEKYSSELTKARYLDGVYSEDSDRSIFSNLIWEDVRNWEIMQKICIYVDPSYKSGPKNDFKAVVTVGVRNNVFYVLNVMAERCTTDVMVDMLYRSWEISRKRTYGNVVVECWVENAGLPDDFRKAVNEYNKHNLCVVPYVLDSVKKGNKFDRIESELVPLHKDKLLIFNNEIGFVPRYKMELETQMICFCKKPEKNIHDDIPDAIQGAVSKLRIKSDRVKAEDFMTKKISYAGNKF